FDWSHEVVLINGVTVTVKVAHIRLCHSRMLFVRAYPRETQEMVFDAHNRAFAFFKGTCTRGIYDNMKTAVETVFVGKDRQFTRRFVQMCGPGIRARDHKITGGVRYRRSDRRSRRGAATDPSNAKAPAVVRSDSGCCLRPCLDAVIDFYWYPGNGGGSERPIAAR